MITWEPCCDMTETLNKAFWKEAKYFLHSATVRASISSKICFTEPSLKNQLKIKIFVYLLVFVGVGGREGKSHRCRRRIAHNCARPYVQIVHSLYQHPPAWPNLFISLIFPSEFANLKYDNICNLCQLDEETPWHLLWDCPAVPFRLKLPPRTNGP